METGGGGELEGYGVVTGDEEGVGFTLQILGGRQSFRHRSGRSRPCLEQQLQQLHGGKILKDTANILRSMDANLGCGEIVGTVTQSPYLRTCTKAKDEGPDNN